MDEKEIERARKVKLHTLLGLPNNGRRQTIKCVFHKDTHPSLVIYPGDRGYNCFSCGANGHNAIDFCTGLGLTFKEAVNQLKDF